MESPWDILAQRSQGTQRTQTYRHDLCALSASLLIAGWRAINLRARSVSALPGGILCQGDAPEGCGNGIRSKRWPACMTRNLRPITPSNFAQAMNCTMASRPTGMTRRGRKIRISSSSHVEQLRISSGAGTVGAARIFTWETTANSGEVDLRSNGGFVHSAKLFEPMEECFACSVGKRSFQRRFPRTGRLSNDHHVADDRTA